MALALTLFILAFFLSYAAIPLLRRRVERRQMATDTGMPIPESERQTPPTVQQPFVGTSPAAGPALATTEPIHTIPPRKRKHTAIAGSTGDGKTTTVNTLLVWDIVHGARCIVCSTHYTAYHPEDQPIDLRPIEHLFEVAYTLPAIEFVLSYACDQIDRRMDRYRAGLDVGEDIVLYLGEWGAIRRGLGEPAVDRLMKILDEGRKTRVWIGGMELHSALIGRLGGDSGMREAFATRLAGNVDPTTWKSFIGKDIPKQAVPQGYWMTDAGLTEVVRPTERQIQMIAERKERRFAPVISEAVLHPPVLMEDLSIEREQSGIDLNTGHNTGEEPVGNTGLKLTKTRVKAIRDAADKKVSRNIMAGLIGGDKGQALALIESVLGPVADEKPLHDLIELPAEQIAEETV